MGADPAPGRPGWTLRPDRGSVSFMICSPSAPPHRHVQPPDTPAVMTPSEALFSSGPRGRWAEGPPRLPAQRQCPGPALTSAMWTQSSPPATVPASGCPSRKPAPCCQGDSALRTLSRAWGGWWGESPHPKPGGRRQGGGTVPEPLICEAGESRARRPSGTAGERRGGAGRRGWGGGVLLWDTVPVCSGLAAS